MSGLRPRLNTIPQGLLSFLGIKSFGENPQYFGAEVPIVQPTWDLREHYEVTNAKQNTQELAYNAGASATTVLLNPITAPSQSFVYVTDLRWRFTFQNVADAMSGMPALEDPAFTGVQFVGLSPTEFVYPAGAAQAWLGAMPNGFWMPPGARLVWFSRQSVNTGGLATLAFTCRFADYVI